MVEADTRLCMGPHSLVQRQAPRSRPHTSGSGCASAAAQAASSAFTQAMSPWRNGSSAAKMVRKFCSDAAVSAAPTCAARAELAASGLLALFALDCRLSFATTTS